MKTHVLSEPELEFLAGNRHIDPRAGIASFGSADSEAPAAPRTIPVGIVGSASAIDGIKTWLTACRESIDARSTKPGQENLHQRFPGFNQEQAFRSELIFDDSLMREIAEGDLRKLVHSDVHAATRYATDLYFAAVKSLADSARCKVIICARPSQLDGESTKASGPTEMAEQVGFNFHDVLKARALSLPCPLQIIKPETWIGKASKSSAEPRRLQDEATRAWNLHTALYYKAGGTPWRLARRSTDLATCFVGISFFKTADGGDLHTAVAQVFNERGDGVVVRGGKAAISKVDRQVHLDAEAAERLLLDALEEFRVHHGHQPARVVVHKTSSFDSVEEQGLRQGAQAKGIDQVELLWVQLRGGPRLFRQGQLPPMRGTSMQLAPDALLLYTRGSVAYFRTYPGLYVPQPILLRSSSPDLDLFRSADETLALSKMNWNNVQLDERDPLTLRTAARVGTILRHVPDEATPATRYGYYM